MTLCPVISQSEHEIHTGFATYFALTAGLFLLSWDNTLLSQVNHKAIKKQKLAGAPGGGASRAALVKPCSRQVQLQGVALGPELWVSQSLSPRAQIPQILWACVPVFDQPYGEQILPMIELAFLILHIVLTALCTNSERSLVPPPSLLWHFAGLGEVPDGPFLGLNLYSCLDSSCS